MTLGFGIDDEDDDSPVSNMSACLPTRAPSTSIPDSWCSLSIKLAQGTHFASNDTRDDDDDREHQDSKAVSHRGDHHISPSTLQKLNVLLDDVASLQNQVYSLARTVAIRKVPCLHSFSTCTRQHAPHHSTAYMPTSLADNPVTQFNTHM
jgi:hypothetical protein